MVTQERDLSWIDTSKIGAGSKGDNISDSAAVVNRIFDANLPRGVGASSDEDETHRQAAVQEVEEFLSEKAKVAWLKPILAERIAREHLPSSNVHGNEPTSGNNTIT